MQQERALASASVNNNAASVYTVLLLVYGAAALSVTATSPIHFGQLALLDAVFARTTHAKTASPPLQSTTRYFK